MGNWERLVWNNRDVLLKGLVVTMEVCAIAFIAAIVVGLALCLIRMYVRPLRWIASVWIEFCRATPIYVQLMWVNYVWPEVIGWPTSFFTAGCVALAMQSSGYLAETFRAGIESVSRGQREAAQAVGMSPVLTFRRIVLPQVLLAIAPSIVTQLVVIVKSSTLISVISVQDLMSESQRLIYASLEPIEILTATAAIYILFIFVLSAAGKALADRLRARIGFTV
ncbi:MAG: amino acid ABC transporter permease [Alphaproteobacteria bacterium]